MRSQGRKAGKETIINYTRYIEESYFCFFIPILSFKIKDQLRYPKKVYFTDNSFLTNLSLRFSKDYGRLYENLVAVELSKRKTKDPLMEFYYWKDSSGKEVDFVIKRGYKTEQLIQVCYDITDFDTKKREITSLMKASKEFRCKHLLIITDNYESEEKIKGKKIKFISLWRWLLINKE